MDTLIETIRNIGIVPVVKLNRVEDALPLGKALIDGNLPCAEVTFRTECAQESIRILSEAYPDLLVGAGTVLTIEQVNQAVAAGAKFIVAPGLNPEVVKYCKEINIPILPGVANASDIELALSLGLKYVKFFPAEINGGLKAISALSGPFPNLKFMPTGGVNTDNMNEYLASNKIIACGGTWMVTDALVDNGKFEEISKICNDAVNKMLDFSIMHVGINPGSFDLTTELNVFESIFNVNANRNQSSTFIGKHIEFMHEQGYGEKGHIAIGTRDIARAQYFLEQKGFEFNEDSKKYNDDTMIAIYLKKEVAGFAIHLLQK